MMDDFKEEKQKQLDALRERKEDIRRILRGITPEAIDLLKEEFDYDLPVTEWLDAGGWKLEMTPEERVQRMFFRDGARSVISFILKYRT